MVRKLCPVLLEHLLILPEIKGAGNEEGVKEGNGLPFQLLCVLHWVTDCECWEVYWLLNCQETLQSRGTSGELRAWWQRRASH